MQNTSVLRAAIEDILAAWEYELGYYVKKEGSSYSATPFVVIADRILEAIPKAEEDTVRLDFLANKVFDRKWDGCVSHPPRWFLAGPYRHYLKNMVGHTFREAVDFAIKADNANKEEIGDG